MMKTPTFWYDRTQRWQSWLLRPVAWLFRLAAFLRPGRPVKLLVPLIAIGNATAGGSGKTPLALALYALLAQAYPDKQIWFLSRGTGSRFRDPTRVDVNGTAADFGDEPMLLAQAGPTVIARHRGKGARYAAEQGADLILMDDGLQNKTVAPDIRLLAVDGGKGFGNGHILPAGPLREPVSRALSRADAVLLVDHDQTGLRQVISNRKPVLQAWRRPASPMPDPTLRYFAFTGIAHPDSFLATIRNAQLNVAGFKPFPDHHAFSRRELQDLMDTADQAGAHLLTTEKDAMRLPANFPVHVLRIRAEFDSPASLLAIIDRVWPQ